MIQTEQINDKLVKTYSDEGFKIKQLETERVYDEAIDVIPLKYTYEETDEKVEILEEDYKQLAEEYKLMLDTISGDIQDDAQ